EAKELLRANLHNGKAIEYFKQFIRAQGGDETIVDHVNFLPQARYTFDVKAGKSGYITELTAHELGRAAMLLGAGRRTKDDDIDLAVGLYVHKKIGDCVQQGDTLCTIYANSKHIDEVKTIIQDNSVIGDEQKTLPLLLDVIR